MKKYWLIILLIFGNYLGYAQNTYILPDSTNVSSIKNTQKFDSLLTFGIELLKPIESVLHNSRSYTTEFFMKYEVNSYLALKLSYQFAKRENELMYYNLYNHVIKGNSIKLGIYFNLKSRKRQQAFLGINVIRSQYDETGVFIIEEPYWGDLREPLNNINFIRRGIEIESGYEFKVAKLLYISLSTYFNFIDAYKGYDFPMLFIPGFGKIHNSGISYGINCALVYKFNLKMIGNTLRQ